MDQTLQGLGSSRRAGHDRDSPKSCCRAHVKYQAVELYIQKKLPLQCLWSSKTSSNCTLRERHDTACFSSEAYIEPRVIVKR